MFQKMTQRPSIVSAWLTGGGIAAGSALILFAAREWIKQTKPIGIVHESIGFTVFALPMFLIILIPAVITIIAFRKAAVGASGAFCLIFVAALTFFAVLIWSGDDKFFPSDRITAASFYIFALAGVTAIWARSRESGIRTGKTSEEESRRRRSPDLIQPGRANGDEP